MKVRIVDSITIILLFLVSINFMNQANYLFVLLTATVLFKSIIMQRVLKLTWEFIVLLLCFSLYFFIYTSNQVITFDAIIKFWLGPILSYIIGYLIVNQKNESEIERYYLAIVFGFFLHAFLNIGLFSKYGFGIDGRSILDIWTNQFTSATLQNALSVPLASLLFFGFYNLKLKKRLTTSILIIGFTIVGIAYSIASASRTIIYIVIIVVISNFFLSFFLAGFKMKRVLKKLLASGSVIILLTFTYNMNLLNLKETYESSNLYKRQVQLELENREDNRTLLYIESVSQIFKYPFGGNKMQLSNDYAHNMWLDIARISGIFPFILIILYFFLVFNSERKLLISHAVTPKTKYLTFSIYLGMFLVFMVEPAMEGLPYMVLMFFLMNGMVRKYLDLVK